ncbi:MAG: hypothetical protein AMJ62_04870 [Myxococcales bacterium SG8_38]|nr:MAG: hypothetical protein AMJ62_04870 [Myxococcales bacterium SG8_38]
MSRLSDGPFGPRGKKLSELTDRELLEERRRRQGEPQSQEKRPGWPRVKQYLANLELSPGATWPDVERAYERLLERYHPDRHAADPERYRAAQELTESLSSAYQALRRHFDRADK